MLDEILSRYDYPLTPTVIANQPVSPRDQARLLCLDRRTGQLIDRRFYELANLLGSGDVLVLNETKVFAARLLGRKSTGGKVELLLIKQTGLDRFMAISKPGLRVGQQLFFPRRDLVQSEELLADLDKADFLQAKVLARHLGQSEIEVGFNRSGVELLQEIDQCGFTPLPPYIKPTQDENTLKDEYQTVYAKHLGSAAAPTAGLHFTEELLQKLQLKGVQIERITLHVGLGTFAKLTADNLAQQTLHAEYYEIKPEVAKRLNQAKQQGKRIIAVGTTSIRSLESASSETGQLAAQAGETTIFITPPYRFKFVDALITNFHLPKSSLLMLVAALVSSPNTNHDFHDFLSTVAGQAYVHALTHDYRFFSFGDAMLIHDSSSH